MDNPTLEAIIKSDTLGLLKQKTVNVYSIHELSQEAKEQALDSIRYYSVDQGNWASNTLNEIEDEFSPYFCVKTALRDYGVQPCYFNYMKATLDIDCWKQYFPELEDSDYLAFSLYFKDWEYTGDNRLPWHDELEAQASAMWSELCDDAADKLTAEYEYLTSDEHLIELCDCMDYQFLEDGRLI